MAHDIDGTEVARTGAAFQNFALIASMLLWVLFSFLPLLMPGIIPPGPTFIFPLVMLTAFALIHCWATFGLSTATKMFVVAVLIGGALEVSSVRNGFPFGHFQHNGLIAPHVLDVPVLVPPAYFALCYIAWQIAAGILWQSAQKASGMRWFVAILAAFIAVGWDVCFDALGSTFTKVATYAHPGGHFGVPVSNYVGWFLMCVSITLSMSAITRRFPMRSANTLYAVSPAIMWVMMTLQIVTLWLQGPALQVTDASGRLWRLSDYLDSAVILVFFVMIPPAITSLRNALVPNKI
jgi:uncharacterized membrane protein